MIKNNNVQSMPRREFLTAVAAAGVAARRARVADAAARARRRGDGADHGHVVGVVERPRHGRDGEAEARAARAPVRHGLPHQARGHDFQAGVRSGLSFLI